MGGYERDPMPWSLDGIPPDFNHRLLDPDWPRFESIMRGAISRVPAIEDAGVTRMINGPEAFTPDNEFILGESEVRGFFVAAGFCAHGIAGTGGIGQQMAHWIVDGEPELDLWKMDIRRFGGQYRSRHLTLARTLRELRDVLRHPLPERGAARRPPAAPLARPTRTSRRWARCSARSRCGSARTGSRRTRTAPASPRGRPSRRCGRAAGPASTGRRRSGRRRWRRARRRRSSTSRASPRSRSRGRARSSSSSGCARTTSTGGRLDHLHADAQPARRDRVRLHGHAPRRGSVPDRDRDGVRQPRPRLDPQAAAGPERRCPDVRVRGRHIGAGVFRDLGPDGARHRPAADDGRPLERGIPVHDRPRDHARRRARARASGDLRRRARLGALRPSEYGRALWRTLWDAGQRARPRRGRLPRDRRAAAREGLPRLVERHHARGDAVRGRPRVRGEARQGRRLHRPRRARGARRPPARASAFAASSSTTRARSPRQRAGPRRRRDRRPRDLRRLRLRGRALDRLRLPPAGRARSARAARSRCSASGSASRSSASRCGTPRARGFAHDAARRRPTSVRSGAPRSVAAPDAELRGWVDAALAWCDETDAIALRHFRRDVAVEQKPDRTLRDRCRHRDRAALRERIADAFPEHGVVGEEFGTDAGDAADALVHRPHRRHPQLHPRGPDLRDPPRGRARRRAAGRGDLRAGARASAGGLARRRSVGLPAAARTEPAQIHVSRIGDLADAQILYTSPAELERVRAWRPASGALLEGAWRDRGFGDFWSYTLVAEGAAEAMVEIDLKTWDAAAPTLLVEEAGGRVTDLDGRRGDRRPYDPRDERPPPRCRPVDPGRPRGDLAMNELPTTSPATDHHAADDAVAARARPRPTGAPSSCRPSTGASSPRAR